MSKKKSIVALILLGLFMTLIVIFLYNEEPQAEQEINVSSEKAVTIAGDYLENRHDLLNNHEVKLSYSTFNRSRHLWIIEFSSIDSVKVNDNYAKLRAHVLVDAKTGEVVDSYSHYAGEEQVPIKVE